MRRWVIGARRTGIRTADRVREGLGGHFWLPDGPSARAPRRNRQPALGLHALSREPPAGGTAGLRDQVRQLISSTKAREKPLKPLLYKFLSCLRNCATLAPL